MTRFKGRVIKDSKGRDAVHFTTPSGVRAVVDKSIPPEALDKFAEGLARKIAKRKECREDDGAEQEHQTARKK